MKLRFVIIFLLLLLIIPVIAREETLSEALQAELDAVRDPNGPAVVWYVQTPYGNLSAVTGVVDLQTHVPASVNDRFRIGSISKTYLAVAILQLEEAGMLSVDDPIALYLSAEMVNNIDNADSVTIRQLLTMTSGIYEYLNDDFLDAVYSEPTYYWTAQNVIEGFVYGQPAFFEPSESFEYTNTNYLLLQLIAENVTGKPLHQILREQILDPIGANDTYTQIAETLPGEFVHGYEDFNQDGEIEDLFAINDGAGLGDGAIVANAKDVARFYDALFIEQRLLDDAAMEKFLTDASGEDYGMGIEIIEDEDFGLTFGHSGAVLGFSSDARYYAEYGEIVVVLHADADIDTDAILDALDVVLGDE